MDISAHTDIQSAQLSIEADSNIVRCTGAWVLQQICRLEPEIHRMSWPEINELVFDGSGLTALDTSGAWLLQRTIDELEARQKKLTLTGFRSEYIALLHLIDSCKLATESPPAPENFLARVGHSSWHSLSELGRMLAFIGETAIALFQACIQPHRIRWRPILHNLQSAGFDALPIVGLLSFLMGLAIA